MSAVKLQVSHSAVKADGTVEWFVVRPLPGEAEGPHGLITNDMAVESLLNAGRTVVELNVEPWNGRQWPTGACPDCGASVSFFRGLSYDGLAHECPAQDGGPQ